MVGIIRIGWESQDNFVVVSKGLGNKLRSALFVAKIVCFRNLIALADAESELHFTLSTVAFYTAIIDLSAFTS